MAPPQPDGTDAAAKALLHDALLDLCPTLPAVQALAGLDDAAFPGGAAERTARLTRALLRAASSGDTDLLSWMLQMRSQGLDARAYAEAQQREASAMRDVDLRSARDDDGTGPLVLASSAGHVDVVHMLVRAGADVDERDPCGWTPLMWATNSSNAPLVAFLLSQGADVEARSSKGTSCEDFILSAAPDNGTFPGPALGIPGPSSRIRSPAGRSASAMQRDDRQVVADLVHEQLLRQRRARQRRSGNHLRTLSSASSAGSYGPSTSPTKPSSLLSPHRDSSPERKGSFSPSAFGGSGTPTLGGEEYGRFRASSLAGAGGRRLVGRNERNQLHEAELRARELAEGRRRALLDVAVMLEVEYSALVGEAPAQAHDESAAHRRRKKGRLGELAPPPPKVAHSGLASGCGAAEVGADPLSAEFIWERVTDDQMLVLGLHDVAPVLDDIISRSKPVRAPWTSRAAPANVVFLCARFACRFEDEELLEELMLGAVDRIEACIYAQPYNMTVLAFWLFNCTLLLHYTLRDAGLAASEAMLEFRPLLVDLINEVYVFVIRDAERRIDKIMDAAILDHDAIPGFEEVRFEGEWSFMKNLTGSVKSLSGASPGTPASSKRPLSQIFARGGPDPNAPIQQLGHARSPSGSASGGAASQLRAAAEIHAGRRMPSPLPIPPTMREASYDASVSDLLARPSPRTVTSLLTSTLHVLQLYEINPAIIVQALSQIFFWVGCELFNRVLTRKRYLCRSRAMQIRLNISALEDWARSNALPLSVVNAHLSPLSQLVSWLQCQSTLREFVDLIATMQGLRALNPLQLRRAVRDYRFEVGEPHMSAECTQYLEQLQKDWERAREDAEMQEADRQREEELAELRGRHEQRGGRGSGIHHRSGTATQHGNTPDSRSPSPPSRQGSAQDLSALAPAALVDSPGRRLSSTEALALKAHDDVDSLFQPGRGIGDYVPPWSGATAPAARSDAAQKPLVEGAKPGELLNSRDMLPFALPSRAEALIVSPGDAFGFGRGHFQGTGTPSLKSVRGDSLAPGFDGAASPAAGLDSRPASPSLSLVNGDDGRSTTGSDEMERGSVASGASSARSGLSAASRSSLFAQGKGIGAGAYWQPVPLLPEGLLDRIDRVARLSAAARPPIEHRLSSLAMTSPVLNAPATMQRVLEQPRPMPTRWESAGSDTFIAPEPKRTRASQYGYIDDEDDSFERASQKSDKENTPQPEVRSPELRQPSTLRANASPAKDARRRPSGLSAAPNRLVLPGRGYAKSTFLGVSESAEEDGDMLATPVDRQSSRPF